MKKTLFFSCLAPILLQSTLKAFLTNSHTVNIAPTVCLLTHCNKTDMIPQRSYFE